MDEWLSEVEMGKRWSICVSFLCKPPLSTRKRNWGTDIILNILCCFRSSSFPEEKKPVSMEGDREEERSGVEGSHEKMFKNWILMWTPTLYGYVNTVNKLCSRQLLENPPPALGKSRFLYETLWQKQYWYAIVCIQHGKISKIQGYKAILKSGAKGGTVAGEAGLWRWGNLLEEPVSLSVVLQLPSTLTARLD